MQIVAENARAAFERSAFRSYRALGAKAEVSANTVRNVLEPDARAPGLRGDTSPRMDVIEKIAKAMGYSAWQLMQPDFKPEDPPQRVLTKREAQFYDRIRTAYEDLGKGGEAPVSIEADSASEAPVPPPRPLLRRIR